MSSSLALQFKFVIFHYPLARLLFVTLGERGFIVFLSLRAEAAMSEREAVVVTMAASPLTDSGFATKAKGKKPWHQG